MTLTGDQLAAKIRDQIRSGKVEAGTKLPSVRALAEDHSVGRGVAQQAINKLLGEGLAVARHGAGVYVRTGAALLVRRAPQDISVSSRLPGQARVVQRIDEVPAPQSVADNFRIPAGESVVLRRIVTSYEARPVQLEDSYFPVELARGTPIAYHDPGEGGVYARLAEQGAEVTRFVERLRGRAPSPEESADLELRAGSAMVLELIRLALAGDRVVEVAKAIFDASVFEVVYDLKA